jgi:hypothetical protein
MALKKQDEKNINLPLSIIRMECQNKLASKETIDYWQAIAREKIRRMTSEGK